MSKPKIIKVVDGVNMGLGHEGLKKLLDKQADIDIEQVQGHELVFCINTKGDKLKVIGCKGLVIGYLRMPHGRKIMREALQYIPRTFGSSGFNYDEACQQAIVSRFPQLAPRRDQGPLVTARAAREAGL